jgi:rRNA biogenesis protein RRP5
MTISKFAQMEFKYGEAERGRTLFEEILSNYPKRVDLWSVYLDMEIKTGEAENIRCAVRLLPLGGQFLSFVF